jgi:hypothetical protein
MAEVGPAVRCRREIRRLALSITVVALESLMIPFTMIVVEELRDGP